MTGESADRGRDGDAAVELAAFDPFDRGFHRCPFPAYSAMRAMTPAFQAPGTDLWFVTRHDLVRDVVEDAERFSNRQPRQEPAPPHLAEEVASIRARGWQRVPTIADEDPPRHDALRAIVQPYLSVPRLQPIVPRLRGICNALLDGWPARGEVEFGSAFSSVLPMLATALVLDLPEEPLHERIARFARWRDGAVAAIGAQIPDSERLEAERSIVEMQHYLHARLEVANPGDDDLFAALRHSEVDLDGRRRHLTTEECLTILQQLFVGGIETTAKLLTEAMLLLEGRDDVWRRMRGDARYRRLVCEELLRLTSPAQGIFRRPVREVVLDGVAVPAEARLVASFAGANRDPEIFTRPDEFDPERPRLGRHLAFGRGTHFCLGAGLARLEILSALEVLADRLESYRVATPEVAYARSWMLRGPVALTLDVQRRL